MLERIGWPDIDINPVSATGLVVSGQVLLCGLAFAESTGAAPATVDVYDGSTVGGRFIQRVNLAGGASMSQWYGPFGLHCRIGLFVNVVAGAVLGSVWEVEL